MFVMRSTYDALQRESDRWATLYETALSRWNAHVERYDALLKDCQNEREADALARAELVSHRATIDAQMLAVTRAENASRLTFEELQRQQARYEALLEKYHALRLQGATARPEAQVATAPPIDDASRVMAAQRSMAIDSAAADYRARGLSPDEAYAEATRTIDSLFMPIAGEFQ